MAYMLDPHYALRQHLHLATFNHPGPPHSPLITTVFSTERPYFKDLSSHRIFLLRYAQFYLSSKPGRSNNSCDMPLDALIREVLNHSSSSPVLLQDFNKLATQLEYRMQSQYLASYIVELVRPEGVEFEGPCEELEKGRFNALVPIWDYTWTQLLRNGIFPNPDGRKGHERTFLKPGQYVASCFAGWGWGVGEVDEAIDIVLKDEGYRQLVRRLKATEINVEIESLTKEEETRQGEHEEKLRREKEDETRRENLYKDGKLTSKF